MLLFPAMAMAGSEASVLAGFEPRLLSTTANDRTLRRYGYEPVGTPFLPSWGLRGRVDAESGWTSGMAMSYGFGLRDAAVPTTTSLVLVGGGPGRVFGAAHVGVDFGFATVTHTVGSTTGGGALTYLGPYLEPRVSWRPVNGPGVFEVSLGGLLQIPAGPAHANPLWEAPFTRRVQGGGSLAFHGGLGTR